VSIVTEPLVKAEGVRKHFGQLEVLKGLSLEVAPQEVVCLIGPSGSGKSTFLRCVNHLEKIDGGRLYVDGQLVGYRQDKDRLYEQKEAEVAKHRAEIGMVFQHFNLFPHMSAIDNVALAQRIVLRRGQGEARTKAAGLLKRVGLSDKLEEYPARLSGG
jgi:polar amino acid transport system ATP-binding protein